MTLNRAGYLCVLAVLLAFPALADDASRMAKADEFFRLAKMDALLKQALAIGVDQAQASIVSRMSSEMPEKDKANFADFQAQLKALISEALTWERVKPAYVKLYADAFTDQELDDIVIFYKSRSGQAMVDKNPVLLQKSVGIMQELMKDVIPKIDRLAEDFAKRARESAPKQ